MRKLIQYFKNPDFLDVNNVYVIFTAVHATLIGLTALIFAVMGRMNETISIGIGVLIYFFCLYLVVDKKKIILSKLISMLTLYILISYFYVSLDYGPVSFLSVLMAMLPIYAVLVTKRKYHKPQIVIAIAFAATIYSVWSFNHFGMHLNSLWQDKAALLITIFVMILGGSLAIHITYYIRLIEFQREQITDAKNNMASFISAISHQLKTPLNGIMGIQDLLESQELESDKDELFQILKHSSLSMMRDMNNIMEISKLDGDMVSLHEVVFDMDEILEDIVYVYKENLFNIQQEISFAPSGLKLRGDKHKLKLMLENIFDTIINFNARSNIEVNTRYDGGILELDIIDKTEDEEKRRMIENLNFSELSIHDYRESNTLGLYITNILAEHLKGTFVANVNDNNIEYNILIPIEQADNEKITEWTHTPKKKIERILLVEDNAISRKIISSHFRKKDYSITTTINGLEALEYVKNNYDNIDLIFMDVQMPVMDGITATRKIRDWEYENAQTPKPIIALTANTMYEDKLLCYSSGMNYFIGKPFNAPKMELLIKKIESNKSF